MTYLKKVRNYKITYYRKYKNYFKILITTTIVLHDTFIKHKQKKV